MNKVLDSFLINYFFIFILSLLGILLLMVFSNEGISNDALNYFGLFERLSYSSFSESLSREITEPGYLYIAWTLSKIFSPVTVFFIVGLVPLLYKISLLRKLDYGMLAVLFYFFLFLPIQEANQIRGALTSCFILYVLLSSPKNARTYIYLAFLASLFHFSGVIILTFYVLRKFDSNIPSILAVIIFSFIWNWLIGNIGFLSFLTHQMSGEELGVTFTSPVFLLQLSIVIACSLSYKEFSYIQKKGFHLILLGVLVYIFFADSPVLAHRIRELSLLGLFPILFSRLNSSYSYLYILCAAFLIAAYTAYASYKEVLFYFLIPS